jgi:hypothetical protein
MGWNNGRVGRVLGSFLLLVGHNQMALADSGHRNRVLVADAKRRLSGKGGMFGACCLCSSMLSLQFLELTE